jgi:hypothetical protein
MVLAISSETTLSERVCDGDEVSCEVQGTVSLHRSFYRAFKEACASLRYSDKLNVHSLRPTACTLHRSTGGHDKMVDQSRVERRSDWEGRPG